MAKKFIDHTASREPRLRTYPYLLPHFLGLVNTESGVRKQLTFGNATTGFPAKWHLRNERRNSILMTRHYLDLGSASDWLNQISHVARPIRSTTQILVVTPHQYGISALVSQMSFGRETSVSIAKCQLFSQAIRKVTWDQAM